MPQVLLERYQLLGRNPGSASDAFSKGFGRVQAGFASGHLKSFYFQMQLQVLKCENKDVSQGLIIPWQADLLEKEKNTLPFELTAAQERSLNEILQDMKSPAHMNRLLQGRCRKRKDGGCI